MGPDQQKIVAARLDQPTQSGEQVTHVTVRLTNDLRQMKTGANEIEVAPDAMRPGSSPRSALGGARQLAQRPSMCNARGTH
jgi:hypothetical protein